MDSMDIFERDNGTTTAETVHRREEFRQIVSDVQELPETQKTALLLREIDALSYEHIAEAMDTTVPSVKSLLVRARVSLAEAAEARLLTCEEVRLELGPGRRGPERSARRPCAATSGHASAAASSSTELRNTTQGARRGLPARPPRGPSKFGLAKLGFGGAPPRAGSAHGGRRGHRRGGAGLAAAERGLLRAAGSAISAGVGTVASKAAAGMAAAVIVTAGAVEVEQVARRDAAPSHRRRSHAAPHRRPGAPRPSRPAPAPAASPRRQRGRGQAAAGRTPLPRRRPPTPVPAASPRPRSRRPRPFRRRSRTTMLPPAQSRSTSRPRQ